MKMSFFLCYILGTLISAFAVFCCGKHGHEKNIVAFFYNILAAILQSATIFLLVGWIWSIRWGILFVQLSGTYKKCDKIKLRLSTKKKFMFSFMLRVCKTLTRSCETKSVLLRSIAPLFHYLFL